MSNDARDDIGLQGGQVFAIGEDARQHNDNIMEDPLSSPILVVVARGDDVGVRVYGPPDLALADVLDRVAREYRVAVEQALKRRQ